MCLTNRNGKGEGACCCCLYSAQPLRGFLHRGDRSFSSTFSSLSRDSFGIGLCHQLGEHPSTPPHSSPVAGLGAGLGLGSQPRVGKQRVCRSHSPGEPSPSTPQPPLLCAHIAPTGALQANPSVLCDTSKGDDEMF